MWTLTAEMLQSVPPGKWGEVQLPVRMCFPLLRSDLLLHEFKVWLMRAFFLNFLRWETHSEAGSHPVIHSLLQMMLAAAGIPGDGLRVCVSVCVLCGRSGEFRLLLVITQTELKWSNVSETLGLLLSPPHTSLQVLDTVKMDDLSPLSAAVQKLKHRPKGSHVQITAVEIKVSKDISKVSLR